MPFSHVNIEFVQTNSKLGMYLPWISFDGSIDLTLCSNCIIAFATNLKNSPSFECKILFQLATSLTFLFVDKISSIMPNLNWNRQYYMICVIIP